MNALLVLAGFGCTPEGEAELLEHLDRTLAETRATPGSTDADAVTRRLENDFHRTALIPAFGRGCVDGSL